MMAPRSGLQCSADLKNLEVIRRFVLETAAALEADPDAIDDVVLAVDEAVTNVIVHGYRGRPGMVEVEVTPAGDALVCCVRDQAPPFDPTRIPAPDITLPPEERPFGGLGVFLMRQFMDEVTHRVTAQGGNELTLVKRAIVNRHKGGLA